MKKTLIKLTALVLAFSSLIGLSSIITTPVFAESDICSSSAHDDVKRAAGCKDYGGNKDAIDDIVVVILNSIIAVIGIVAVIFIVIGGINYMTSQGDPGKLKKARDTILYACIGLVVCALAFAIVNWTIGVINNSSKKGKPTDYSKQEDCENAGWTWSKADSKATKETCHE